MSLGMISPEVLTVTPGEREVAVARVPAGTRVSVTYHDGTVREVRASVYGGYMALPAPGLGWGAQVCTWPAASGVALYKKARDRKVWQRAARVIDAGLAPAEPAVAYVVLELQEHYGKPVWVAVRVRREGEELGLGLSAWMTWCPPWWSKRS